MGDEQTWTLLGELLRKRREELGYRYIPPFWRERAERAGHGEKISERTIRDLENNSRPEFGTFTGGTLSLAARIYGVTRASMDAVAAGEARELMPAPAGAAPPPAPARRVPSWMTPDEEYQLRDYLTPIWKRLWDLAREGIGDPSGAQLFGEGTRDAADWDAWRARGLWEPDEMVAMLADVHRRTDTRGGSSSGTA